MLKTSETVREFMEGFYAKDRSAARRFEQKVREIRCLIFVSMSKKYGTKDGYTYTLYWVDNKKIKASPSLGSPNGVLNRMLNASANNIS